MPNTLLELAHIKQFLKLLPFETSEPQAQNPPEPDFNFQLEGKLIGVEHTQLMRLPDNNGNNIIAHYRYAEEILQNAYDIYKLKSATCLMVHVSFKSTYGLSMPSVQLQKNDVAELSEFIANFVHTHLPRILEEGHMAYIEFETWDYESMSQILPEKIDHISITNTCDFKTSVWAPTQGAVIPGIFESLEFQETIRKKNKKPNNYKGKYDEIWLLIVEDSMDLTTYFHFDNLQHHNLETTYNRIFILRRADDAYIELPLSLKS